MPITCWGDSLTAAGGLTAQLAALSGRSVTTAAVGGENSLMIAARCNALPLLLQVTGPTRNGFEVSLTSSHHTGTGLHPLLQGSGVPGQKEPHGSVLGISGRLRWAERDTSEDALLPGPGDRYEFVPDDPTALAWQAPEPFLYDAAEGERENTAVLWTGQNGPDDQTTLDVVEAFAQWTRAEFVVMTAVGHDHRGWTDLETRLQRRWGRRFMNVRRHLVDRALDDLGMAHTPGDRFDAAQGRVPRSLRTDHVHHTPEAQHAIAEHLVWPRLQEFS